MTTLEMRREGRETREVTTEGKVESNKQKLTLISANIPSDIHWLPAEVGQGQNEYSQQAFAGYA